MQHLYAVVHPERIIPRVSVSDPDVQLLDLIIEGSPADPENLCRRRLIPFPILQRSNDEGLLRIVERGPDIENDLVARGGLLLKALWKIFRNDDRSRGEQYGPLNDVLQLADIPGPPICQE